MKVVMVRPSQSLMLNIKKQHTERKKRSEGRMKTISQNTGAGFPTDSLSASHLSYPIFLGMMF